ncbi:MAG: tripartite tricarboxylate transporter substrate binding protein [Syntrophales bacterium LBB04]|nr:tripartite tricarboxylate transporter substrate binding protein [Syntrophales bacterium LBB04]
MNKKPKIFGFLVLFFFLLTLALPNAFAQKFPTRPITFFIPAPPGGTTDINFRALVEPTSKILGQPIVAVNKAGASGTLAPASLKTVKPDGYTLSVTFMNTLILPHMEDVAYNPLEDFTYIIQVYCSTFGIVVKTDSPWKTLKDLVEYARQHPNEIKYSTSSPGGVHHFAMEEIALKEGVKWKIVPYPGGFQAVTAVVGGHVQAASQDSSWASYYHSGKIRVLAVFGTKRNKYLPDVPTLKELGYSPWSSPVGIIGPAKMDKKVVNILHDAFKEAMKNSVFNKTLETMILDPCYSNTEDYDRYMRESYPMLKEAVKMVGLEKKK